MTLDKRQTESIQEGKGLTESKLNQEFVDFLQKFSTPILLVVCVAALAYVGWDKFTKYREGQLDDAWLGLEKASQSRSPDSLLAVASENAGELGVPLLARAEAADILLQASIMGTVPGAELDNEGKLKNQDDALTPQKKDEQLAKAAGEYQKVLDGAGTRRELVLHRLRALFGLAAVEECRGKFDDAKARYESIIATAKDADLPAHADAAKKLLDTIDEARSAPRLLSDAQVVTKPPPPPAPPAPVNPLAPALTPVPAPTTVVPLTSPTPSPTPAPTPTPAAPPAEAPKSPDAPKPDSPK